MKHHQLEAFYQVMLTGSISQAARNLGRTQPAVSMTIISLEEQLGATLFDRNAGRLAPRAEARILFERLRPVMEQLRDIRDGFKRQGDMMMPRASIITANNVGTHLVPSSIADLADAKHPVRIMNGSAANILSDIENQLHDIAVCDQGPGLLPSESPLYEAEAFNVPIYAIFRRGLLGEVGSSVAMGDLEGHRICSIYHEHQLSQDLQEIVGSSEVEFQNFFPMACFALQSNSVALVDYITCTTIAALTGGALDADWRPLTGAPGTTYFLLRPRYRMRSAFIDHCYERIRSEMIRHSISEIDREIRTSSLC